MSSVARQRRPPRLAEEVANDLRRRILGGEFSDGDLLPIQDELVTQYGVSLPSVREGLRVLETEGLITVRRGKMGGSIVQLPRAETVAYTVGLVLESRQVEVDELVAAMAKLGPLCARACAERADRAIEVIPTLEAIHGESVEAVDDPPRFAMLARRFHEELVARCGSQPLVVLVGALESLWSGQVAAAGEEIDFGALPQADMRNDSLDEHRRILDAIVAGDGEEAERAAHHHQADPQRHSLLGRGITVSATPLRDR
jgi:DNA-binding FadR family transcriptional regulator